MLKQHGRLVDAWLRLADLTTLAVAMPAAHYIRFGLVGEAPYEFSVERYWPLLAAVLFSWMAAAWVFDLYDVYRTQPISAELSRLTRSLAVTPLAAGAGAFLWRHHDVPRGLLVAYVAIAFVLLAASRLVLRQLARAARLRGYNTRHCAVVGAGDLAEDVVERIAAHPQWGYRFAGYVLDDGDPIPEGAPVLGRVGQLGALLAEHVLDEVIFAVPSERLAAIQSAARLCEEQGVAARICIDVQTGGIARLEPADIGGLPAVAISTVPSNELALAAKRAFDLAVSAVILALMAPVLGAVALLIWIDSPGPVLFRQRRIGLHGREFFLYKFRSMHRDAESRLAELRALNEVSGPVFKMKNDPRVTRVGSFIRKTSLDEFPQFWNVLRGEMSIVGPRPPLPAEVRQYKAWQRRRLSVKPGITCEWQVSGRSDIDFERWMELDLQYIDTWSLWNDIRICARTIPAVFLARGSR